MELFLVVYALFNFVVYIFWWNTFATLIDRFIVHYLNWIYMVKSELATHDGYLQLCSGSGIISGI